jgi:N-acetylmuramoyl-L-alanine amidase
VGFSPGGSANSGTSDYGHKLVKNLFRSQRGLRWATALLLLAAPVSPLSAKNHKPESWITSHLAAADQAREALSQRPTAERSRRDYQKVIAAYRQIYYGSPTSTKAATSVNNVAELLAEMGRQFDSQKDLRAAVQQYEFLRREYPSSKFRGSALFAIAEIYKDDLHESDRARETFDEFVRRYPNHPLAGDARIALAEPAIPVAQKQEDDDEPPAISEAKVATGKDPLAHVTGIRHWSTPDYTRVVVDLDRNVKFVSQRIENPARVYFDLVNARIDLFQIGKSFEVDDSFLKQIRVAQYESNRARIVLDVDSLADYDSFFLSDPARLIIDIRSKRNEDSQQAAAGHPSTDRTTVVPIIGSGTSSGPKKVIVEADDDDAAVSAAKQIPKLDEPVLKSAGKSGKATSRKKKNSPAVIQSDGREARPSASGDRSLIRALGLKIGKIVIDPGHGGHDTGTIGPRGLLEKDLVLDVCHRLGKLLDSRMGAEVIFTRSDDTFVPLETRTAIANQEQADLFVSVHANSSRDADARGVETYYLNFNSSPEALEVAARENAVSEKSIHELQDLVKKIALKEKIDESREFASDVQQAMHTSLAAKTSSIRDRGVKKAPFIVLIGANMPSILAEISFVSNPTDERKLRTPEYRQRIAESLYRGISKYVGGLSGIKVAAKVDKGEGQ